MVRLPAPEIEPSSTRFPVPMPLTVRLLVSVSGTFTVWSLALLCVSDGRIEPLAAKFRPLPPRVNPPAEGPKVSWLRLNGLAMFWTGARRVVPANATVVAALLAGVPPAQLPAVDQLLSPPPPVQEAWAAA